MNRERSSLLSRIIPVWMICAALAVALLPCSALAAAPNDPKELETFLDGFLASAMKEYHIPGLVFVMVKNGKVFLAKGYGFADLAAKRPVDPQKTIFRVASVSKLFTGTAIMQLVEQGKLDLNEDVNTYLKSFKLPDDFPEPVTTLHLLTHTAGFDEQIFGMEVRRPEDIRPLGEYLAHRMPRRAMPAGDVFSYSNHGVALAGLLVEEISGMPFNTYVTENIFKPLGMDKSSFILTEELKPDLAQGYYYEGSQYQLAPFDYSNDGPAGSLVTCGADMARFMLAHLQDGRLGNARILSKETAELMHIRQFAQHPKLPGSAVSFREDFINGRCLIGHGGNWRGYTSRLVLDPEANLGFFLSYNALSSAGTENGLRIDLVHAFYDRYFPVEQEPLPAPPADAVSRAKLFEGAYRHNRYIRDSFGKLAALLYEWKVQANPDGSLMVYAGFLDEPVRLVEVEPYLFLRGDGKGYAAFREGADGKATHFFIEKYAADRISCFETMRSQVLLVGIIVIVLLSGLVGWPVVYALRKPRAIHPPGAQAARWIAFVTAVLFIGSLALIAIELSGDTYDYAYGVPTRVALLLYLNYLIAILIVAMVISSIIAWGREWWTLSARIHYTVMTLAAVTLIPILIYWRLLGYGY